MHSETTTTMYSLGEVTQPGRFISCFSGGEQCFHRLFDPSSLGQKYHVLPLGCWLGPRQCVAEKWNSCFSKALCTGISGGIKCLVLLYLHLLWKGMWPCCSGGCLGLSHAINLVWSYNTVAIYSSTEVLNLRSRDLLRGGHLNHSVSNAIMHLFLCVSDLEKKF